MFFEASGWDTNGNVARTGTWQIQNVPTASVYPDFDLNFYEVGGELRFQLHGRGTTNYVDPLSASFYGDVNINADSSGAIGAGSGDLSVAGEINASNKVTITNSAFNNHLRFVRSGQGDLFLTPSASQLLLGGGGFSSASNNAYDLGRSDKQWNTLYLGSALKMNNAEVLDQDRQLKSINGIGATTTNTASGQGVGFKFVATDTVVDQAFNGFLIDHNVSGSDTATADRTHIALHVDQDSSATGGDTSNEHRIYGISVSSKATGDSDLIRAGNFIGVADQDSGQITSVYGINAIGRASGEATTVNVYGAYGYAQKQRGGNTTAMYGNFGHALIQSNNTGAVGTAVGSYGEVQIDSNTTLTTAYGVRSIIDRNNGTINTGYLYRGNYQGTLPTNPYGVYIDNDVPNFFGGTITGKSFIKTGGTDGQFLKADGSVQESTATSPQGTLSPFDATNNQFTFLINVSHLDGLVTGSQTATIDFDTGELEINSQGELNIKANSIEASKIASNTITANEIASGTITATQIAADTITGTQIDTDTLNVKHFDNVSTDIKSHLATGAFVPLLRYGSAIRGAGGNVKYIGSNASFVPVTITNVRNNATYTAVLSAVLGDVSGGRVQYSTNNSTWINASGGESSIFWSAGTFRGYVYTYQGQVTTLSNTQSTVYWRVYFSGGYNHTHMQLHVTMDNTT